MAKKEQGVAKNSESHSAKNQPRSLAHYERGITNATDFANLCLAVGADLIAQRITPAVGNSACANNRNLLKMLELKLRYGTPPKEGGAKELLLT